MSSALSAIPGVGYFGSIGISGGASFVSACISGNDIYESALQTIKSMGITALAGGITRAIGLGKIFKIGKGNYAGKKVFLNNVKSEKLASKLSSFNPAVNKSQTLFNYIKEQVGLKGLSQIASDTAGSTINTIADIAASIVP